MSFLDPLFDVIAYGAKLTQLGAIAYGAEVRATLAQMDVVASTWHYGAELNCVHKNRLA
jgi:hypothetical protein